jgi:hypothetical protein
MKKPAPINLVVHFPQDEQGRAELAARVALVHADVIRGKLAQADCPAAQKLELIDAVKLIHNEGQKR